MKVSEIARSADVNPDTVRFYTREGLLQPRRDPENGYQLYGSEDLRRLRFARKARQLGFSLKEIGEILSQAEDHNTPCPLVREIFEERLRDVEKQLQDLQALRDRMHEAMQAWQVMPDSVPDGHTICRLIEKWDNDEAQGARSHES